MTSLQRSIFVIPSSTLEDIPKRMGHELALDFLTAWTSQWDPRLLVGFGTVPEWKKADGNSLDIEHSLILCPKITGNILDQPQRERLQVSECLVIDSNLRSREQLVHDLLAETGFASDANQEKLLHCDDFYALGYAVLQIQILARKLRYSWNIDWMAFTEQALSAAKASLASDEEETERWIQACFDSLSQERDRYCSQQAYLIDVVLLASTTLGDELNQELKQATNTNLLASASILSQMKQGNQEAWNVFEARRADKTLSLIGGLQDDEDRTLASAKAQFRQLKAGLQAYSELGTEVPKIFSRFGTGFTSSSPSWISQFGYRGVLLNAWSDGTIPEKDQAKIRWQSGIDGNAVDTIIGHVLDASNADSFVDLANHLAKQLDYHQVPTMVFAHWPMASSIAKQDLLRVIARSPSLGSFHTAENYFATTTQPYTSENFPSSKFKGTISSSAVEQAERHHRIVSYEKLRVQAERLQSLSFLWTQMQQRSSSPENSSAESNLNKAVDALLGDLDKMHVTNDIGIADRLATLRGNLLQQVRETLSNKPKVDTNSIKTGYLIVNPANHPQRLFLENLEGEIDSTSSKRIVDCDSQSGKSNAIVDLPPFGFVRIRKHAPSTGGTNWNTPEKPSLWKKLAGARTGVAGSDWTLANEYMEIQIDPKRGHLRSMYIANKRGSRLSGMVTLIRGSWNVGRKFNEADTIPLTDVRLRIVQNSRMIGTIEVSGVAKLDDGQAAKLVTRYTLWKGSRSVHVEIEGENLDPTQVSCVWRTAWLNEGATVSAWQHGVKGTLQGPLQSTVELIEIDDAEHRIYLAPVGISSHRKAESRILISDIPILSSKKAFAKLGIGIEWPRPYEMSLDFCDRPWIVEDDFPTENKTDEGAWLAQCTLPSVHLSFIDPAPAIDPRKLKGDQADVLSGKEGDACVFINETQAKSGSARLNFFRDVAEAWRVDCQGREFDSLSVIDGQVAISIKPNEQSRVLIRWKHA